MKNKPANIRPYEKPAWKKALPVIGIVLGVCVLVFFIMGFLRKKEPSPENASEMEICRFISSRQFREMGEEQRRAFMESVSKRSFGKQLGRGPMPPGQQENFLRNMTMVELDRAKYFFKQDAETQKRLLAEARSQRSSHDGGKEGKGGKGGKGGKAELGSHKRYLEGMSAEDRAVMNAFERRVKSSQR
ncbi:MAG: hypothetical protein J5746_14040 [Victivallales bacterium]|nr:hypothetical protein [Victivallales bacterium]